MGILENGLIIKYEVLGHAVLAQLIYSTSTIDLSVGKLIRYPSLQLVNSMYF